MKKSIMILIAFAILISLCACNSYGTKPDDVSQAHYEYGKKALDIADQYLDGRISAEDADRRLGNLYDYGRGDLPETEYGDTTHFKNFTVEHNVVMLQLEVSSIAFGTGSESEFIGFRNDLAKALNERKR